MGGAAGRQTTTGGPGATARRWALIALALLGVGLVAAPFVFKMFDRAPKGAKMITGFEPYMKHPRLDGYQTEIDQIDAGVVEGNTKVAAALAGPTAADHRRFERAHPTFAQFVRDWAPIKADMNDLIKKIQANVGNYEAVKALPNFKLFPWFFVIPGALLALIALAGLARGGWLGGVRIAAIALGAGLVLAPAVFQMFTRAPKGATMVKTFKTLETRHKVETIQGYFGTIALGQGAVRLELEPALRRTGLTTAQVRRTYPGITTLDRRWIPILNDLTPMIGAMSDNVDNYNAVAALPDFRLFPWFFVAPGLIAIALALAAVPRRRSPTPHPQPIGAT